jgi:ribosomal protein S18 acetylase RimI-like enzyme
MIIRTAQPDDVEAYRTLRLEALLDAPTAFGADYEHSLTLPLSHWQERLADDSHHCLYFAVEGNRILGMAGVLREASPKRAQYAMIWGVFVRTEARGQRMAEQLVNTCLEWARNHEAKYAKLAVTTTNAGAIRCYIRCGFRVYGVEPGAIFWDGVYYDDLLMVREV